MPRPSTARRLLLVSIDGLAAPYLEDPGLDLPHLAGLRARGAGVSGVRTPLPGVTWPCHTTLITAVSPARHGVLGNLVWDRRDQRAKEHLGDRAYDKADVVACPTLYDLAHAAGLRTAAVCWPQTRNASTLDWNVPEALDQSVFERYATPELWEALRAAGLPIDRYAAWSAVNVTAPMQDRLTTDVARHLIARHRPELLLVHYLALDAYQHEFGPDSGEARWALGYVDAELGRLLEALARADLTEPTTVAVVSDHGFAASRRAILPNVWLGQEGVGGEVAVAANGGVAGVTVRSAGARGEELLARLRKALAGLPGVAAVYGAEDFPALGLPQPTAHPHAPDLLLAAEADAFFANDVAGPVVGPARLRGMHGHPPTTSWLTTAMIAAGPGVALGAFVPAAELAEVGATAAALLGIAFPHGAHPLRAVLSG